MRWRRMIQFDLFRQKNLLDIYVPSNFFSKPYLRLSLLLRVHGLMNLCFESIILTFSHLFICCHFISLKTFSVLTIFRHFFSMYIWMATWCFLFRHFHYHLIVILTIKKQKWYSNPHHGRNNSIRVIKHTADTTSCSTY